MASTTSKGSDKSKGDGYNVMLEIPDGIDVKYENNILEVKGEKGTLIRKFFHPRIVISIEDNKINIEYKDKKLRRKDKAIMHTWRAHIRNMFKGVTKGYKYKLKIYYSHFPMTVKVEGDKVVISNFLGEKGNRYAKILDGVKVEVKGDEVIVSGIDKEKVGQTAANIELATKNKSGRDPRKFADGIYIIYKDR